MCATRAGSLCSGISAWIDKFRRKQAHIFRTTGMFVMAAGVGTGAGCSLVGTWRLVETRPQGAPFPVSAITFDREGRYASRGWFTAEGAYDGEEHTASGDFTRKGSRLSLKADKSGALAYRTRRRLDGKLSMTFEVPGQKRKVTAIFERAGGRSTP